MKKVTIPTCANPFVVIVNGMKYTYPAGETVEVPDDVAAVIEQHHDAHNNPQPAPVVPPFVPSEGESGGGGLPVVELSTPITADTVFTDAENAALTEAYESGMPIVLKCSLNYTGTTVDGAGVELVAEMVNTIATAISMGGAKAIYVNYLNSNVLLVSEETVWVVVVE